MDSSTVDGDTDEFVHHSTISESSFKTLDEDGSVSFEVVLGEKGAAAINVVRL